MPGKLLLGLAVVATSTALLWSTGYAGLIQGWISMQSQRAEWQNKGIWLPSYRVAIEAHPIGGLSDNLSGLTYSGATGTLFSVINRPPSVAEMTTEGKLIRHIELQGAKDPEGITHVSGTRFIIADEATHRLSWIDITPETTSLDITHAPSLTVDLTGPHNMGIEGISWDEREGQLITVHEMWPVRVMTVTGLEAAINGAPLDLGISDWAPEAGHAFLAADLSSVTLHEATGNLLLLSHVNAALYEYAPSGKIISQLPLWSGYAGLQESIPQAEGVAVGADGAIYIVSEPNYFYRLERQQPASWAELGAASGEAGQ